MYCGCVLTLECTCVCVLRGGFWCYPTACQQTNYSDSRRADSGTIRHHRGLLPPRAEECRVYHFSILLLSVVFLFVRWPHFPPVWCCSVFTSLTSAKNFLCSFLFFVSCFAFVDFYQIRFFVLFLSHNININLLI